MVVCVSVLFLEGRELWTIELWSFEVSNMEPGPNKQRLGTLGTMKFECMEARPSGLGLLEAGTVELGSLEARPFGLWAMESGTWELEDIDTGSGNMGLGSMGLGAIELMGATEQTLGAWAVERVLVGSRPMANRDICKKEC